MFMHKESLNEAAFAIPELLSIDGDFFESFYINPIYTQGINITKYTMGDTTYQPEKALQKNHLSKLPSKVSKRYSPQKREHNTGGVLPPEPSFMKKNQEKGRIISKRDLLSVNTTASEDVSMDTSKPIPGVDFARTNENAAALLERLGQPITYEAHHTYKALKDNRIVERTEPALAKNAVVSNRIASTERLIQTHIPEKTYNNIQVSSLGNYLDKNSNANNETSYISTNIHHKDTVNINKVLMSKENSPINLTQPNSTNLIAITENTLVHQDVPEIENTADIQKTIRGVIHDYVDMKKRQMPEKTMQMKNIEHKVKQLIQSDLQDENIQSEAVNEMKQIIREVILTHPQLLPNHKDTEAEFSLAIRDEHLRVQIEQELRDKFESRIRENNKDVELHTKEMFEDLLNKYINP